MYTVYFWNSTGNQIGDNLTFDSYSIAMQYIFNVSNWPDVASEVTFSDDWRTTVITREEIE